jgi:hypothetical protein
MFRPSSSKPTHEADSSSQTCPPIRGNSIEVVDLAAYKAFHTDVLGMVSDVASITWYIVMESAKD